MTMTIYTIGTQGRHDEDYLAVMKQHEIDAIIDIHARAVEGVMRQSRRRCPKCAKSNPRKRCGARW